MLGAIEVRTEAHAVVRNFAQFGKTERPVAAGIGEDRSVPDMNLWSPPRCESTHGRAEDKDDTYSRE